MAFVYDDNIDYKDLLEDVHQALMARFKRTQSQKQAQELEKILSDIKKTARSMSDKRDPVNQALYEQYADLINEATSIQNTNRSHNLGASTLFSRTHGTKVSTSADDIFEEDLSAILAAAAKMNGDKNYSMETYLFGASSAKTRSLDIDIKKIADDNVVEIINKMAEKAGSKYRAQNLRVSTGKIDVKGYSKSLEISKDLPHNIQRLMELMKDATFTAKNYKSFKKDGYVDVAEIGLHLGQSNLYKAITGTLSEIGLGSRQQASMFFRGANTYLGNNHGYANEVAKHFTHMRTVYELRGSGLLDETGTHVTYAKYLIYNDPSSDAIYVKDTASLLYEMMQSDKINLFGGIGITAGSVKSNK